MSFESLADVEEALRTSRLTVRALYGVWEQRQPVADPAQQSVSGGARGAGRQIPWIQTDLALAGRFTALALEQEEFLLVCDAAREILRHWTGGSDDERTDLVGVRMSYASALTRLGSTQQAVQELRRCTSPEFQHALGPTRRAGILMQLGDIHRDEAHGAGDSATRQRATEEARQCYERALALTPESLDALVAVAGTSAVLAESDASGREPARAQAHARAREILDRLRTLEDRDGPRFRTTRARADACVVLGRVDEAVAAYARLQHFDDATIAALADARYRAQVLAEALGAGRAGVTAAFPPLQLIVFTGHLPDRPGEPARFPLALVDTVREAMRATLAELHAGIGMASAAAGADLLFIDALRARNGTVHVILPWAQDEFRRTSIRPFERAGAPAVWEPLFDTALRDAATIREIGQFYQPGSSAGWEYLAEVTAGLALYTARVLRLDVQPVALWDGHPGRGPGGTASFVGLWRHHLGREPLVIEMPRAAAEGQPVRHVGRSRRAERPILHQEVKSMLFADIVGYSKLSEHVIPEFVTSFLDRVSQLAATSRHAPRCVNTWGDALYAVFDFAHDAGGFALELTRMLQDHEGEWLQKGLYWEESAGDGTEPVKHPLDIRVGLHSGPVFLHFDPVVRHLSFIGAHVSRAARIEPIARPGEVFASEEFAALAELGTEIQRRSEPGAGHDGDGFVCEYAGSLPLAKGYPGRFRIYRLLPARRLDVEGLAKAAHDLYCEKARARGETPDTNSALRDWRDLSEDLRDANRAQAADIPNKLRLLGYELTHSHGIAPSAMSLPEDRVEAGAEREHERWMAERRRQGWTYAPVRDNARKHHPLLVDWNDLPEKEKDKDRNAIQDLPRLVQTAGFRVRPVNPDRAGER